MHRLYCDSTDEERGVDTILAVALDAARAMRDVRPEVAAFSLAMERKLRANDARKGRAGWKDNCPDDLLARVHEEAEEVTGALRLLGRAECRDPLGEDEKARDARIAVARIALLDECADVANMAMMVADAANALDPATVAGREP